MNELKPCPFCGSAFVGKSYLSYTHDCTCIECNDCHARGKICGSFEDASYAWNMRVESSELDTLREQVKMLREACQAGIDALGGIMNYYGTGLQVINWHLNGDSEPFDNFIDDDEIGCALDSLSEAIEQTKPKDGD